MNLIDRSVPMRGAIGTTVQTLGVRIASGYWSEGETLSHETVLMEQLGISRSVLREAFRILSAKGMIASKTSVGTSVRPRSSWRLLDPDVINWRILAGDQRNLLGELMQLRLAVEPGIIFLGAQTADDQDMARVSSAWAAKEHCHNSYMSTGVLDGEELIETDMEFHAALIASAKSDLLDQLFTTVEVAIGLLVNHKYHPKNDQQVLDYMQGLHHAIYLPFINRDAAGAEAAMRTLLRAVIGGQGAMSSAKPD